MSLPPLGSVAPADLVKARVTLHQAVQIIASAGHHLAPPQPDDGHRRMQWEPNLQAFRGVNLDGDFFVRIKAVELVAEVVKSDGAVLSELELYDAPLVESLVMLQSQMPVARSEAFTFVQYAPDLPDPELVARALPLEPLKFGPSWPCISPTRRRPSAPCAPTRRAPRRSAWPHHFDIGTVLSGSGPGSTIGVGMSPGDAASPEPYWYVTPSGLGPATADAKLPGPWEWHTEGWTGISVPVNRQLGTGNKKPSTARIVAGLVDVIEIARRVSAR